MSKRRLHTLIFTIFALLFATTFDRWCKGNVVTEKYASIITDYLIATEKDAMLIPEEESDFLQWQMVHESLFTDKDSRINKIFLKHAEKDYTYFVFKEDSIYYYNNNKALPTRQLLPQLHQQPSRSYFETPSGKYYFIKTPLKDKQFGVFVPIQYSNQGKSYFPASSHIPIGLTVNEQMKEGFPINNMEGKLITTLHSNSEVKNVTITRIKLALFIIFLGFLCSLMNGFAMDISQKYGTIMGGGFLLSILGIFIGLKSYFSFNDLFLDLPLFNITLSEGILANSLGDWLFNISVLLWLMVFFHREFNIKPFNNIPVKLRFLFGAVYYLAMLFSIIVTMELLKQLIYRSNINFDFDNVFNMNRFNLLAILGVILLMGATYLFSHRMIATISKFSLPLMYRALAMALAALITVAITYFFNVGISVPSVLFFSILYVATFDAFISSKDHSFYWVVGWLFIYSAYATLVLYYFNAQKDENIRLHYAKTLSEPRDSLAETDLNKLLEEVLPDTTFDAIVEPFGYQTAESALITHLSKSAFKYNYLFYNFKPSIHVFNENGESLMEAPDSSMAALEALYQKGKTFGNHNVQWHHSGDLPTDYKYIARKEGYRNNDTAYPKKIFIYFVFTHEFPIQNNVYNGLFAQRPYKNLELLDRFDYVIFENNSLIHQKGKINTLLTHTSRFPAPQKSINYFAEDNSRVDMVYRSEDSKVTVVVGRQTGGYLKYLYLFSWMFTILSLFMLLLAGVNSVFRFLPGYYEFYISTKGSLAKRIQYYTVGLIFVSLITIGYYTYSHQKQSAQLSKIEKVDSQARPLLDNIVNRLEKMPSHLDSQLVVLGKSLKPLSTEFKVDIDLYTPKGDLLSSSRQDLADNGLIPPKMSSKAFLALSKQMASDHLETNESTGSISYTTHYYPLRNSDLKTIGYIGLPSFINEDKSSAAMSDFVGQILTIFVFILILAIPFTTVVSSAIIKPLDYIVSQIKQLRLEDKNQPLSYSTDGQELNNLIEEYNRMVQKLEDTKPLLLELERKDAWRGMARQVAHEIKNPLTTMKLSLQHLERISNSNTQDVHTYLKTAIIRMIEQIDGLAHIASDFSMFAQINVPEKNDIILNHIVEGVYDYFSDTENIDFEFHKTSKLYHIQGEQNHLRRVFNNLIINASQAIPEGRLGKIKITIYDENNKVFVCVEDNGDGIPEHIIPKVFQPSFTTKSSGSGLGLAICKEIIEALDGQIYFETVEGIGTKFLVTFPIIAIEEQATRAEVKSLNAME